MRTSHSSSSAGGRAFSAGNDPTIPALHWAITRSGTEMMNSGAPITGIDRRPLNSAGIDIREFPFAIQGTPDASAFRMPDIIPTRQSRSGLLARGGSLAAATLLAQCAGNVVVGPAIVRLSRPAGNQH